MGLEEREIADGNGQNIKVKDVPARVKEAIDRYTRDVFLEYVIYRSHIFTRDNAPDGSIFAGDYFGKDKRESFYVISDYIQTTLIRSPDTFTFERFKGDKCVCTYLHIAHKNFFADRAELPETLSIETEKKIVEVPLASGCYFFPKSPLDGSRLVNYVRWKTMMDDISEKAEDLDIFVDGDAKTDWPEEMENTIVVKESIQNREMKLDFSMQSVEEGKQSTSEKAQIESFLDDCMDDDMFKDDKELSLELVYQRDSAFHKNMREALGDAMEDYCRRAYLMSEGEKVHPGHDGYGCPREGYLDDVDATLKSMNSKKFSVELADGTQDNPGSGRLAGPLSEKMCPVEVTISYVKAHEQGGSNILQAPNYNSIILKQDDPIYVAQVLLHELGHSVGMTIYDAPTKNTSSGIGVYRLPPGLKPSKAVDEKDKKTGRHGNVYVDHGHCGPHCAAGLSDDEKKLARYRGLKGGCILFGGPTKDTAYFCEQCRTNMKARDLSDFYTIANKKDDKK